jgi:PKD repeat protein
VDGTFNALQLTADPPPDGNCGAPPSGNGNYTYGYGYLNILAAGLQYCSNISSLQGTVRNALTQVPVPDAQVQSELPGGFTWEVMSAQDGTYSLTLPVGVYTVTVDAMGYTHWITTGIEISLSQVYTLNPALVPQGWLTGIVTDAISGAPLDAWVSANGLMTFTQPGTGFYRLDLDAGIYTVQAGADGYSTTQKTASITAGEAMSLDFALLPLVIPRPPLAMFESNTPVCLGKTMVFTNTTNPGVPVTVTYGWDFGDGLTSTLEHPVHDYNAAGNYLVTLDACNATGCDTNEDQVEVIALPEAGFVFVTNGLTVTFTNTSMAATNFLWDFGDGEISSEINPTHTFDRPGIYSVWLGASSGCGLSFDHADLMVMPVADLGIQLVEWPDPVDVGGLLTYTLNISNSGPHVAIEVSAKLSPTVELAFVSVDGGGGICSFKEGVVSCTLDQLAPMEDWTMIVVVQAPSYPTSLTSVASLGAQVFDSNPENDLDTLITRVVWRGWYYIPLILKE